MRKFTPASEVNLVTGMPRGKFDARRTRPTALVRRQPPAGQVVLGRPSGSDHPSVPDAPAHVCVLVGDAVNAGHDTVHIQSALRMLARLLVRAHAGKADQSANVPAASGNALTVEEVPRPHASHGNR
jgi:hypothetical protein